MMGVQQAFQRRQNEPDGCVVVVLAMIAVFIVCAVLGGCKKQEEPKVTLSFSMYSQAPKFTFRYIDADRVGHVDTIYSSSAVRSFDILEADMTSHFTVSGVTSQASDSVHIRCDVNGRRAESGVRVQFGMASASVQPSQAK